MAGDAFLVPRHGGLISMGPGRRVEISDLLGGWSAVVEGVLADDVAELARAGTVSPRLRAMASSSPAIERISSWTTERWVPLTPLDALRLDGFDTLFLELTGTCNERCLHCYADSGPTVGAALDRATCEAVIDDAAALGFRRIQLTGGDPLLCAFLPDLVERAARHPFTVREIYTNGLLLKEPLLDRLADSRPSFAFSYYSHVADTHDRITRTPGSQRRTRRAIELVVARGLPIRASIVVLPENQAEIAATVAELRALGVTSVADAASRAVGRGEAHLWDPEAAQGDAHRGDGDARAEGRLAVTYQGDVVPCIFNRASVLGRVGPARLTDILATLSARPTARRGRSLLDDRAALACAGCRTTTAALRLAGV
jgi:MoaA/NifB/PqqE/SkfB family radical SAM enzyme